VVFCAINDLIDNNRTIPFSFQCKLLQKTLTGSIIRLERFKQRHIFTQSDDINGAPIEKVQR